MSALGWFLFALFTLVASLLAVSYEKDRVRQIAMGFVCCVVLFVSLVMIAGSP